MAKVAFLGMPGYQSLSAFAARGFWLASSDPELQVERTFVSGSLLARGFNQLWCWALNAGNVDYFAMQHSDVEPPDGWLNALIGELEDHDLDVLSVVIPIKSPAGLTSTALHKEGDNWQPLCRLTMKEIHQLPRTFTSEDVGHPLLVNTGLWVCRFGEWAKHVHFEINDRIIYSKSNERYEPQVESEDWYFSRLCHELGLKVGATRRMQVNHRGSTLYPNWNAWGSQEFDDNLVKESVLPKLSIAFPYNVEGWLTPLEGDLLGKLAEGKKVLEIGSYCGRSTICMAQTAEQVDSVDTHDGRGTPNPRSTYEEFKKNLRTYGLANVRIMKGVASEFRYEDEYDMVFIDGAHDLESVCEDIAVARSVLKEDGVIAFHDYSSDCDPEVKKAVDAFLESGATLIKQFDTVAVVSPPPKVLLEV